MATPTNSPPRATITFANIFRREDCRRQRSDCRGYLGLSNFRLFLPIPPRQAHRIFVRALAESAFHTSGEADRCFAKLVAQMIGGREGFLPTLLLGRLQQIKLVGTRIEIRGLHSQQSYRRARLPIVEKQAPRLLE